MADAIQAGGRFRAVKAPTAVMEYAGDFDRRAHPSSALPQSLEKRTCELIREYRATFPANQFDQETTEELDRLQEAGRSRTQRPATEELAIENVIDRWMDQGIWNPRWNLSDGWKWKHEEPLEPESEWETDSAAESSAALSSAASRREKGKARRLRSDGKPLTIEERRYARELDRQASRPYHQFLYQVSKERERIQEEANHLGSIDPHLSNPNVAQDSQIHRRAATQAATGSSPIPSGASIGQGDVPIPVDINSTAYERVKSRWIKRETWNVKWGVLPGMSWAHERPFEEMLREEFGDDALLIQASALGNDEDGAVETSFWSRFQGIVSAVSNDQGAASKYTSQQQDMSEPDTDADTSLAAIDSDDDGIIPITRYFSKSPSITEARQSTLSRSRNPSPQQQQQQQPPESIDPAAAAPGEPSIEGGQAARIEHAALGPVHEAKVTKTRGRRGRPSRVRINASEPPSVAPPSHPGPNVPESSPAVALETPRRSRRLQKADLTGASGKDAANSHPDRSQPRATRASAGSKPARLAKLRGASKGRRMVTRRMTGQYS